MIELVNVSKKIQDKLILEKVSLSIGAGEFIAVVGESGSGKTTLLNVIGHLDSKDSGKVIINEMEYQTKKEVMTLKKEVLGFIFQNYLLMENETVLENLSITGGKNRKLMIEHLEEVGMDESYLAKKSIPIKRWRKTTDCYCANFTQTISVITCGRTNRQLG